jgi:multisubunit Na+/H+ antiporter MnhG subunit
VDTAILNQIWESLKLLALLLFQLISNPVASIVAGAVLAIAGRYVVYGVGLALIAYGVIKLVLPFFGFKL